MKTLATKMFQVLAAIGVMVVAVPQASAVNLIANPSMETGTLTGTPGVDSPDQWFRGGFGTNDRALNYPATGIDGTRAASITISSYTDGDAKWYFADVPVIAGHSYTFKDAYTSDVVTELTAQFSDATHTPLATGGFQGFFAVPASAEPATATATFTVPSGASFMTVYHILKSVGTLRVDNYSLEEVPGGLGAFEAGFVSLTFDDGYVSHPEIAQPILDSKGYKGTFYLVTNISSGFTNNPGAYFAADGTHPVAGWYYASQNVIADKLYRFTDSYKGPAHTLKAYVTLTDNSVVEAGLDSGNNSYPASVDAFATTSAVFYIPVGAKSVQMVHEPTAAGLFEAKDFSFGATTYMTQAQALALQAAGHEVSGHTETHPDLTAVDEETAEREIIQGRQDLLTHGITPAESFAYPVGNHNALVESLITQAGYTSGRTVTEGLNSQATPQTALMARSVTIETTGQQIQAWVNEARVNRLWLILVYHNISTDVTPEKDPFGTFPGVVQATVDVLEAQHMQVCTVAQGISIMNGGSVSDCGTTKLPVDTAPVITLNGAATVNVNVGDVYVEQGATAVDDIDPTVSVTISGTVNTAAIGIYTVTYNATDSTGHEATPVTRTVVVSDANAPLITLLGDTTVSFSAHSSYIEPGFSALDNVDGDVTAQVVVHSNVNMDVPGTYQVTYDVKDASNNNATQRVRTVVVTTEGTGSSSGGGSSHRSGGRVLGETTGAHPNGTLVTDEQTIYLIKEGQRYGFRNGDEFLSHGYSYDQAVRMNDADKALAHDEKNIVKALPGTLVIDAVDGRTVYIIGQNQTKRGFVSEDVFTKLGYRFGNLPTINLSDYITGDPITDGTGAHPDGALVLSGQTIWWILGGKRNGFESKAVIDTYGFASDRIVPASEADMALEVEGLVLFRDGTLVHNDDDFSMISDSKVRGFESAAVFDKYGYQQDHTIEADLKNYEDGDVIR